MRRFAHPPVDEIVLPALLSALADPVRLTIVRKLYDRREGLCCADASPAENLPKSTLSNHFRVLREAGLIRTEKHGLQHISQLRRSEIDKKFPGLLKLVLKLSENEHKRTRFHRVSKPLLFRGLA